MAKRNDVYYVNANKESMLEFTHGRNELKLGRAMYYVNRGSDEDDGCLSVRDLFSTALVLVKPGMKGSRISTDLQKTIEYLIKNGIDPNKFEY